MKTIDGDKISFQHCIDDRPLGKMRLWMLLCGFYVIALDGADVISAGFIYSELKKNWGVSGGEIGALVTSGLVAMAIGAFIAGPAADRWGKKRVLNYTSIVLTIGTFATALTTSLTSFAIARSVTMAALGAALPVAIALLSEFMPAKRRSFLVATAFSGYTAGSALCGLAASWIIPMAGWHVLLYILAILGLLSILMIAYVMPESTSVLIGKPHGLERALKQAKKLFPTVDAAIDAQFQNPKDKGLRVAGVKAVLSPQLLLMSLSLWLCYFVGICVIYIFQTYFPLLAQNAGYSLKDIGVLVLGSGVGGLLGAVSIGYLMDRMNRFFVLALGWICCAASFWYLSHNTVGVTGFFAMNMMWGFLLQGCNTGLNALAASLYPASARATGVAWMHTFGRLGAITTGVVGGLFLHWGWNINQILLAASVPLLVGVALIVILSFAMPKPMAVKYAN